MSKEPMYKEGDIVCWQYEERVLFGSWFDGFIFHSFGDLIAYWRIKKLK